MRAMNSTVYSVSVRRVWDETERLKGWSLKVPSELAEAYTKPGQVVVVHDQDGDRLYLAIASPVGGPNFDFLLGENAAKRLPLEEEAEVKIEAPIGRGYEVEMAKGKDVLIFAVGSGLAPLRPLIEMIAQDRSSYGRVVVYLGAHTAKDFPYAMDFGDWYESDIEINRTVSKPWVQDCYLNEKQPMPLENAVAYVSGMKVMMDEVRAMLVKQGLPQERISTNW